MGLFAFVSIGILAFLADFCRPVEEYTVSQGVCRGGNNPENNAGEQVYYDQNCKDHCDMTTTCTAYDLDQLGLIGCATYTSVGATGDGSDNFICYMKQADVYSPSKKGELCSDQDLTPITDKDECYRALMSLQHRYPTSHTYLTEFSSDGLPKWCFILQEDGAVPANYFFYWNPNSNGIQAEEAWQICISYETSYCNFEAGDANGGRDEEIGQTSSGQECAALVMKEKPLANGATWVSDTKTCWAEFNANRIEPSTHNCDTCQSCIFQETKTTSQTTFKVSSSRVGNSLSDNVTSRGSFTQSLVPDNATSRVSFTQSLVPRTISTETDLEATSLRPSSPSTTSNNETNSNENSGNPKDNIMMGTVLPIIGCVIVLVIVALIVHAIFRRRKPKGLKEDSKRKTVHELYWNVDVTKIDPFPNDADHVNKKNELRRNNSRDEKGGSKGQQVMENPSYESEIELDVMDSKTQGTVLYLNIDEITTIKEVYYDL